MTCNYLPREGGFGKGVGPELGSFFVLRTFPRPQWKV